MVLDTAGHNRGVPARDRWPLAAGLAAGVALDALVGDPRRGHPVAAFGRAAAALEARDYADSRGRGAAHTAACVLAVTVPAVVLHRRTRGRPPWQAAAAPLPVWAVAGACPPWVPAAGPVAVPAVIARDGGRHPSPNAGRCEAAFAAALGVRLGGTNVYRGVTETRPDLGEGRAPEPEDIRRAIVLSRAVTVSATVLAMLITRLITGLIAALTGGGRTRAARRTAPRSTGITARAGQIPRPRRP